MAEFLAITREELVSTNGVLEQLADWREDLINLSRANRLVYFRRTKTSTLEIKKPLAAALLERLSPTRGIRFWEPPPAVDPQAGDHDLTAGEASELVLAGSRSKSAIAGSAYVSGRRTRTRATEPDDQIACDSADREALSKALRWLERRSAQEFMDKGLWILYLGIGMLDWVEQPPETGAAPEEISSPVVLVPVKLKKESAQAPFELYRAEEDAVLNPALAFKLHHDFGISLPSLEDQDEDNIDGFLDSVREAVADQPDWSLHDRVVLSLFSFHKEAMYRDLQNNEVAVAAHPIVQSLALGHRANTSLTFAPTDEDDMDEAHPPESLISILDCDATQRQCLVAAASGHTFVMEGPPGTGKSQTIANAIADALGHGKTVLFVSEKAAALEVVQNRLELAGLSEFILELHSHKATRKQVAQALGRSLTTRVSSRDRMPEVELQQLIAHRRELTAYARAMNERREPIGRSVHEIVGELSRLQHLPHPPPSDTLDASMTAATLARIYDAAETLSRAWRPVDRSDEFLWRSVANTTLTQGRKAYLVDRLSRAIDILAELNDWTRTLADETGLSWRGGVVDAGRFEKLLRLLVKPQRTPFHWFLVQSLRPLRVRCDTLGQASERRRAFADELEANCGPGWRTLSVSDRAGLEQGRAAWESSPMRFLTPTLGSGQALNRWVGLLRGVAALIERGERASGRLIEALPGAPSGTAQDLARLIELASHASTRHRPAPSWFDSARLPEVIAAVDAMEVRVTSVTTALADVGTLFSPSVLEIEADALALRFREVHRGLGKLWPAHWRDRRTLRQHVKSGKVRREDIDGLARVVECQRHRQALVAGEAKYASVIGAEHYASTDTDFQSLRRCVSVAESVVRLAGGHLSGAALAERFSTQSPKANDVAAATTGTQDWAQHFAAACSSLGPEFDRYASGRGLSALREDCEAAAGAAQGIAGILAAVARASDAEDVQFEDALSHLVAREQVEQIEAQFRQDQAFDVELLGPTYAGYETDFDSLRKAIDWVEDVREVVGRPLSSDSAQAVLSLEVGGHQQGMERLAEWQDLEAAILEEFTEPYRPNVAVEFTTPFADAASFLGALADSVEDIVEWGRHSAALATLNDCGLAAAAAFCIQKVVPAADASAIIRRSALESWVEAVRRTDPRLRTFASKDRDHIAGSFRDLDRRLIQVATARAIEACNARRPTLGAGAAGLIASEANKQKRHMPIRRLIEQAAPVVQALKPCMMMSPLSVSQFLPPSMRFDLVIFDEASQVKPADAINCVYRGRQLIIAGDQKQLPPTPFFDRLESDAGDEWEEDQLADYESVLDIAKGAGLRSIALRWHYRSQHEDLITYSNYSFYDGQLVTFPSAQIDSPDMGVELFVVPGIYRRGGARDNPIEAAKVVERILFHIHEHPTLSIGVVAFSEAQASTIENEIRRRAESVPGLRIMLNGDRLHGGFVKNLESVQGDERDIIIFSIGYGRDEAGRFTLNFGPLNKAGGHRRLNVAITRARRRVEVVSSIESADFVGDTRSDGVRHLRRYLDFAARRGDDRLAALAVDVSPDGRDSESPFEEEVGRVVRSWGYEVTPQVGCADYRIDLAVKDPNQPGRYCLAIECDGAMYHSSRVARDRDRLRQDILERLGWTNIHRIWGLSWYGSRGQEEIRLRKAIERAAAGHADTVGQRGAMAFEPEAVTIELADVPDWVVPYRVARPRPPRTSAAIHESAAQDDLQRMILEVVRVESPVAAEIVLRRVRESWGMNRAGSRARSAFDTALRALRRRGEIVPESSEFLTTPNLGQGDVRAGDPDDPDTNRGIHEIPPSELRSAVVRFVEEVHAITEDELTARVANVFGWNRRGADIADGFKKVVRKLVADGVLVRNDGVLQLRIAAQGT